MKGFEKMKIPIPKIAPTTVFEILKAKMSTTSTEIIIDKLSIITRGNLFDGNRIQEIWNMNTGQYDYFVDAYLNGKANNQNSVC